MTKLIEKNTTIPTSASQVFSTAEDNQTAVTIHVLQGEREMASGNKSLGRFDLSDIPPAPRGVPQIEVTFDIDADGILHVSAKDKGTGKEQSITIRAGSGLSEDEVEQMIQDAEEHADEDKKQRELVEARNQAESLVHSTRKSLEEYGENIDASDKESIESAIAEVEQAMEGDDKDAIEQATEKLAQASHKLAEQVYQQAGAEQAGGEAGGGEAGSGGSDDDVIDAEFTEGDDSNKNQ
jgi:molecular chaperone DnaK